MATQGQHLQQVMSPTPGPEATGAVPSPASQPGVRGGGDASQTTVNGTTTGVGVPSPSGLAQPIGDGIQQTMMDVSSGPSTSTAGPVPSPQLPQETVGTAGQEVRPRVSAVGRTGGDGTLGQVGGLGTAGVTYGAVSTTEVADASGVHGDATAVTQGFSVATESGMASAQINVATGVSGYNPSAANPGSSAEGFETPRSTVYGASAVMQTGAQAFASHWLGRVQSLFGGAANVQPMPQAWAPSPLTSPPRQSRPLQPLERGGRILQDEGQVPLFTGANAQQLAAMEQRAPLLYGSPDRHPHTESSSIPHDAIQAEVARQLDGLKQQLRAEQERAGRAEAEFLRVRSQQAGEVEATALQQVGTREVGLVGLVIVGSVLILSPALGLDLPLLHPHRLLLLRLLPLPSLRA